MDEKTINTEEQIEIDLSRLLDAVLRRGWLVVLAAVLCAVMVLLGTCFFVAPKYQSAAMFYVNNNAVSADNPSLSRSPGDISASRDLVKTYLVILDTRETLQAVIDHAGVDLTYSELRKMLEAEAVDHTELFQVTVTGTDPQEAELLADAVAAVLTARISDIVEGTSAKVVDAAVRATRPSSPNYFQNTALGFVIGFVLMAAVIVLGELFDTSIRTQEDLERSCSYPVLAAVPDMEAAHRGGYYGGYGSREGERGTKDRNVTVGADISFGAAEAYKLLRTKLQYSFADEGNCRIIGISGAMAGEGKSLTAVNLAYALSQLDKRVLLIDCDMRRSALAANLPVAQQPGLSGFLSGQAKLETLIRVCGLKDHEKAFHVIPAGQNPPNPVELLSSARMAGLLEKLRGVYDYVLLDLPPVGEVSDALAVAKETDGMLLVVRRHVCSRVALHAAVRQFEFVESRLLGLVFNCAAENAGSRSGKHRSKCGQKS